MIKPGSKDDRSLIERFEKLDDEVPISDDEAKAILAESGIDPKASLARLFQSIDAVEAKERQQRFARAEIGRDEELSRLEQRYAHLSGPQLRQQLTLLQSRHPELRANFRNFERANDDELRSLLVEIEELISRAGKK
jgi:hypothetical protein